MGEPQQVPAAPGNTNTVSVPVRTFNEVKTVSLAFVGDHQLIKDNVSDWANTGSLYPKPEFTYGKKSAPVSRTKDTYLVVEVELEVWPYEAPQMDCTIKGVATWGQTFVTKFPLKGGTQKVILHSEEKLPDKVTKLSGDIEWTVDNGADGPMSADHAWGHEVYVTFDKPRNVGDRWLGDEGVTVKRMSTAVEWVEATGSLRPHEIMVGIRRRFGRYTLKRDPAVPAVYNHPDYLSQLVPVGGAWPMVDYLGAPAGASVYKDKDALLNDPTFWGLIWVEDQGGNLMVPHSYKVVEIVRKY